MFSVITNIYNKKTKGHTLMELFKEKRKRKKKEKEKRKEKKRK